MIDFIVYQSIFIVILVIWPVTNDEYDFSTNYESIYLVYSDVNLTISSIN